MYKQLKKFFKEINVSPYDILDVPKDVTKKNLKIAYKYKAKILHPDKNHTFDTTAEFQILGMAYDYIKEKIQKNNVTPQDLLKNQYNSELQDIDQLEKNDFSILRTSAPKTGYGEYTRTTEIDYSKLSIDKPEQLMKRFNLDKFNTIFDHLKDINEPKDSVVKHELSPFQQKSLGNCEVITDGELMLVGEQESLEDYTTQHGMDYSKGFLNINSPSKNQLPKDLDYSRSAVKNQMKKMKESEIKNRINDFKPINQTYSKNFSEMQADFINNQMESMRNESQRNKSYIKKNTHLFPKNNLGWKD